MAPTGWKHPAELKRLQDLPSDALTAYTVSIALKLLPIRKLRTYLRQTSIESPGCGVGAGRKFLPCEAVSAT